MKTILVCMFILIVVFSAAGFFFQSLPQPTPKCKDGYVFIRPNKCVQGYYVEYP
jgi:hypothetical protein